MLHLKQLIAALLVTSCIHQASAQYAAEHKAKDNKYFLERYEVTSAIQQRQNDHTLLVEYIVDEEQHQLYIFTIEKNSGLQMASVPLPDGLPAQMGQFSELLQSLYLATDKSRNRFIGLSHQYYNLLIAPIEAQLKNKTALNIITDKYLNGMPFEVLVSDSTAARYPDLPYLVKRFSISYAFTNSLRPYLNAASVNESGQHKDVFGFANHPAAAPTAAAAHRQINTTSEQMYALDDKGAQASCHFEGQVPASTQELYGLGVQNLILAQWKMSDRSVKDFLAEVYNQIKLNDNCYATAVQKAKLEMLKKAETAVPNLWSAFLLIRRF